MIETRQHPGKQPRLWLRVLAMVCVLLLVGSATVQAAHSHAEAKTAAHCQVCFTIHSALPVASAVAAITFSTTQDAPAPASRTIAPRFWNCPLANGPPSSQPA